MLQSSRLTKGKRPAPALSLLPLSQSSHSVTEAEYQGTDVPSRFSLIGFQVSHQMNTIPVLLNMGSRVLHLVERLGTHSSNTGIA